MHLPKIITPDFASSGSYSYDDEGAYYFTGGAAGGYGILPKKDVNPKYILALLNSVCWTGSTTKEVAGSEVDIFLTNPAL